MQVKKTRREQAEDTKRHIFEVAIGMLETTPFDSITVRDIVRQAGVSIGTFYNYYSAKLDVFYETYQLADEYFVNTVAPGMTQHSAADRVLYFFDEYVRYSSEITDIALTKILYNADNKCFDRASVPGMKSVLRDQVLYGMDRGEFRSSMTTDEIVDFLMIAARGLVYNWCTHDGDYPVRERMQEYVRNLLRALE